MSFSAIASSFEASASTIMSPLASEREAGVDWVRDAGFVERRFVFLFDWLSIVVYHTKYRESGSPTLRCAGRNGRTPLCLGTRPSVA